MAPMTIATRQLLDDLKILLTANREMKGQTWIEQKKFSTLVERLRRETRTFARDNGSRSLEEPLRSSLVAVLQSINQLEELIEEGLPLWGKVVVDREKCLKQLATLSINLDQIDVVCAEGIMNC